MPKVYALCLFLDSYAQVDVGVLVSGLSVCLSMSVCVCVYECLCVLLYTQTHSTHIHTSIVFSVWPKVHPLIVAADKAMAHIIREELPSFN